MIYIAKNSHKLKSEGERLKINPLAQKINFNLYICIPKKLY
ncbi:hypothetical protein ZORO111903_02185 [Zobellia roscoffensis]